MGYMRCGRPKRTDICERERLFEPIFQQFDFPTTLHEPLHYKSIAYKFVLRTEIFPRSYNPTLNGGFHPCGSGIRS